LPRGRGQVQAGQLASIIVIGRTAVAGGWIFEQSRVRHPGRTVWEGCIIGQVGNQHSGDIVEFSENDRARFIAEAVDESDDGWVGVNRVRRSSGVLHIADRERVVGALGQGGGGEHDHRIR
jgi:hypothetical protein